MKVFIHIGTHKAGSTTIQRYFSVTNGIIDSFHYYKFGYTLARKLCNQEITIKMIPQMKEALYKDLESVHADKILLSGEAFIGSIREAYADSCRIARFVREIFSDFDVHIFVVFRSQIHYYESSYQQFIKSGEHFSWDEYLELVPWTRYNWDKIISGGYEKVFGASNITVFPFELFYADRNPVRLMSEYMGIPYHDAIIKKHAKDKCINLYSWA